MRMMDMNEVAQVSGGLSVPPEVERDMQAAYAAARAQGLSFDDAVKACIGVAVAAGIVRDHLTPGLIFNSCTTGVSVVIKAQDRSPSQICETVDGGTWNPETRDCELP